MKRREDSWHIRECRVCGWTDMRFGLEPHPEHLCLVNPDPRLIGSCAASFVPLEQYRMEQAGTDILSRINFDEP